MLPSNTRYIVFIQTKYHQNIRPANDVSASSLDALIKTISSYRWWHFRSIRIYKDDITALRIYERNFQNYKNNVLEKSNDWRNVYIKFKFFSWFLDRILYHFVYMKEVNKFWEEITNSKSKYLIDKTDIVLTLLYWEPKKYDKNKDDKEIIKHIDCHNWNLIINEKIFELSTNTKSGYFLSLLTKYLEKNDTYFIELYDFIELYENTYNKDDKDYDYLTLSVDNIKNSYLKTINKSILDKYDKKVLEIKNNFIQIIQDWK